MDYKEKYEKALDVITKIRNANSQNKELIDFIEYNYPELKETEDEKIRKEIISVIKQYTKMCERESAPCNPDDIKNWFAWLEKQKERKPVARENDFVSKQNPVEWSKEDKNIMNDIILSLQECMRTEYSSEEMVLEQINWLKSLRPQKQWKPTEEQLSDLWNALCEAHPVYKDTLKEIYEQLKEL